jgi:hypothetical protein
MRLKLGQGPAYERRRAAESIKLFDEIRAMTWRLLHQKK